MLWYYCGPYLTTGKKNAYIIRPIPQLVPCTSQECNNQLYDFLYRDFLLELPAKLCKYPSGIKAKLEGDGALPHYFELTRKDINWDVARTEFVLEGDELPVSYGSYLPAPKRRKE